MVLPGMEQESFATWDEVAGARLTQRTKERCREHKEAYGYELLPKKPVRWELAVEKESMMDEMQDAIYDYKVVITQAAEFNNRARWILDNLTAANMVELKKVLEEQYKCLDVEK